MRPPLTKHGVTANSTRMYFLEPGPSPPHRGCSGFVKNRVGLTFLITRQGTAAIDSLCITPVSAWLQNLPTFWQMTVLSLLGILLLMLFGCCHLYLWHLFAVPPPYIPDPRDITEEGQTKMVRVVQGM